MKALLLLILAVPCLGAPLWVEKGAAPVGMNRAAYRDTGSMRPALFGDGHFYYSPGGVGVKVGDWVWVKRASDGRSILHVVTSLNATHIYTAGLACRQADGWSPRSAIIGVVRFIERRPVTHLGQVRP